MIHTGHSLKEDILIISTNKVLHATYTGLPMFLAKAKMNFFDNGESDSAGRNLLSESYFIRCYTFSKFKNSTCIQIKYFYLLKKELCPENVLELLLVLNNILMI